MKITLPKTWITDPSCPMPGNPRVADDFRLRGYFLTYDQAEKILEALVAGESHARCFDDFRANPTAESCEEAIKIMTGERVENVTGEK